MELAELSVIAAWNKFPIRVICDFGYIHGFRGPKAMVFDLFERSGIYINIRGGFADLRPAEDSAREEGAAQFERWPNVNEKSFSHRQSLALSRTIGLLIIRPSSMATDSSAKDHVALALGANAMKRGTLG